MTQPLWYLRHEGRVVGPFPAPQIKEFLRVGEVSLDWEASLDEVDWMSLRGSEQFAVAQPEWTAEADPERVSWQQQREKARNRWMDDAGEMDAALAHDKLVDDRTRQALHADHARTQRLVEAELKRGAPVWAGLLGLAAIIGVGYAVWVGQQGEPPIKAGIMTSASCAAALAESVNWTACDKRGLVLPGAIARNARLERTRLDNAQLARADLAYAQLKGASLRNADLQDALLTGADLSEADLTGANLSGARLDFALLNRATLEGTRLTKAQLDRAQWSDGHVCAENSLGACR